MAPSSGQLPNTRSDVDRVVVTGTGIITSLGCGWQTNAEGFREGRLAFRDITLFDTSAQRVRQGGEVLLPAALPPNRLSTRQQKRLDQDRASVLLLHAACEALEQAGWDEPETSHPLPLMLGTSAGAMAEGERFCRQAQQLSASRRGQATRVHLYQTQHQGRTLADAIGASGPTITLSNACASGANAIGHAFHWLKEGRGTRERALAGGYDALAQLVFAGFDSLQALTSTLPPRPFDANRDGLALGEGAAVLCLETLATARRRQAPILAEIRGYGATTDVHHLTQPDPEGGAALRSMRLACREAGIGPSQIDYLNSHGTGTPHNDQAEGRAIQRWAGADTSDVSVSSTKASIGHLLGGAGAVEAVASLMALQGQWLPPTCTVETPDPICTFDLVREPRDATVRTVLTNSFGFGGSNATLVFGQLD